MNYRKSLEYDKKKKKPRKPLIAFSRVQADKWNREIEKKNRKMSNNLFYHTSQRCVDRYIIYL